LITDSFVVRFPPLNQQLLDRLYRPEPLPDHPHDDEEGNQDSGSESDGGPDDGPEGGAERMAVPEAEQPLHERDLHIQYPLPVLYYDRNLPHLRPYPTLPHLQPNPSRPHILSPDEGKIDFVVETHRSPEPSFPRPVTPEEDEEEEKKEDYTPTYDYYSHPNVVEEEDFWAEESKEDFWAEESKGDDEKEKLFEQLTHARDEGKRYADQVIALERQNHEKEQRMQQNLQQLERMVGIRREETNRFRHREENLIAQIALSQSKLEALEEAQRVRWAEHQHLQSEMQEMMRRQEEVHRLQSREQKNSHRAELERVNQYYQQELERMRMESQHRVAEMEEIVNLQSREQARLRTEFENELRLRHERLQQVEEQYRAREEEMENRLQANEVRQEQWIQFQRTIQARLQEGFQEFRSFIATYNQQMMEAEQLVGNWQAEVQHMRQEVGRIRELEVRFRDPHELDVHDYGTQTHAPIPAFKLKVDMRTQTESPPVHIQEEINESNVFVVDQQLSLGKRKRNTKVDFGPRKVRTIEEEVVEFEDAIPMETTNSSVVLMEPEENGSYLHVGNDLKIPEPLPPGPFSDSPRLPTLSDIRNEINRLEEIKRREDRLEVESMRKYAIRLRDKINQAGTMIQSDPVYQEVQAQLKEAILDLRRKGKKSPYWQVMIGIKKKRFDKLL